MSWRDFQSSNMAAEKLRNKSRAFSDEETCLLIGEWYKYPCLYEKGCREYHDRNKRDVARTQIALSINEALGYEDGSTTRITGMDVQKKLENLRTYFGKERGKEVESRPRSGAAAKEPFKSYWPWYTSLLWLKDHIPSKETVSNLSVDLESTPEGGDDDIKLKATPSTSAISRAPKLKAEDKLIKAAEAIANKIPDFSTYQTSASPPKKTRLTDDEHFGQMVARRLSKLPESEEKESLKLDILILIKNIQFGGTATPT